VRQFTEPVRLDRAAGVDVRIDERRQSLGRLDDVVELETDLAEHVEIRAEAGGIDDHVRAVRDDFAATVPDELDAIGHPTAADDLEPVEDGDAAVGDRPVHAASQARPIGELVVGGG
jgi:hypothetical protein